MMPGKTMSLPPPAPLSVISGISRSSNISNSSRTSISSRGSEFNRRTRRTSSSRSRRHDSDHYRGRINSQSSYGLEDRRRSSSSHSNPPLYNKYRNRRDSRSSNPSLPSIYDDEYYDDLDDNNSKTRRSSSSNSYYKDKKGRRLTGSKSRTSRFASTLKRSLSSSSNPKTSPKSPGLSWTLTESNPCQSTEGENTGIKEDCKADLICQQKPLSSFTIYGRVAMLIFLGLGILIGFFLWAHEEYKGIKCVSSSAKIPFKQNDISILKHPEIPGLGEKDSSSGLDEEGKNSVILKLSEAYGFSFEEAKKFLNGEIAHVSSPQNSPKKASTPSPATFHDTKKLLAKKTETFFRSPEWIEPGKKYFLFQPSGGFGNQIIILKNALVICKLLNRICILPLIGPHTTRYVNYNKLAARDMVSTKVVFDLEELSKTVPILPLENITIPEFEKYNENKHNINWWRVRRNKLGEKRMNKWDLDEVKKRYGDYKAEVLYFSEGTMWECFDFIGSDLGPLVAHLRPSSLLRRTARLYSNRINSGNYNALHVRFDDPIDTTTKKRMSLLPSNSQFLRRMSALHFKAYSTTLYIATSPEKASHFFFNIFRGFGYDLLFSKDIIEANPADLDKLMEGIPKRMYSTMLGILEQLICARGLQFVGTQISTFSKLIRTYRRDHNLVYDDTIYPKKDGVEVFDKEAKFSKSNVDCLYPDALAGK